MVRLYLAEFRIATVPSSVFKSEQTVLKFLTASAVRKTIYYPLHKDGRNRVILIAESVYIFMYRRPILCTLYGAVDFLNVLKKYIMYL
jgi:hypothetical protein